MDDYLGYQDTPFCSETSDGIYSQIQTVSNQRFIYRPTLSYSTLYIRLRQAIGL